MNYESLLATYDILLVQEGRKNAELDRFIYYVVVETHVY